MIIVINSAPFIKSECNDLVLDYFIGLSISKPEQEFIFISSSPINHPITDKANIKNIISSPKAGNYLMQKIWLDYTLPALARKHSADILIHTDGTCCLRYKARQWLFLTDLSFLNVPQFFSKQRLLFIKRNMPLFLKKATGVFTCSDFIKKGIVQRYSPDEKKINPYLLLQGDHYRPADWQEKEAVKEQYSDGKEYFLFSGQIHPLNNLLNLLKAFSFFKKRQKSNMQLLITSPSVMPGNVFLKEFETYKYRSEVKILTGVPDGEVARITRAAYAFVYPVIHESAALYPLRAMQCGVPVVTSHTAAITEALADAALYADPANFEDIADKMMVVFKDENKRASLIAEGRLVIQKIEAINQDDILSFVTTVPNE